MRMRPTDIPLLADDFLALAARKLGRPTPRLYLIRELRSIFLQTGAIRQELLPGDVRGIDVLVHVYPLF